MCLKDDKKKNTEQTDVDEGHASPATDVTGGGFVPVGEDELKVMRESVSELDTCWIVLMVRDLSSTAISLAKETLFLATSATVSSFFAEVGKMFRYEPNSFALTYQMSNGDNIELNDLSPDKCLGDVGFTPGSRKWNNLILTNLHGFQPRKIEEDDLSLGASASPTSSVSAKKMWFDVSPSTNNYEAEGEASGGTNSTRIKQDTIGYVGLVNQAMTCYLNSLLQTLFMTPEFRNALYRWEFKGTEDEAGKNIPYQLQKLFLQLQTATRSAVETTNLTKSFGWDSSEVWQQHDIQELYRVMFDALEQCFKNTDQSQLINNLYEGKMKDYVKCLECSSDNAREDCFLDIPLPIRPFGSNTAYKSVEEALRAFVEPELLTGNNKYECTKCSSHCDAHKGLKFTRFPYLLTLHLKRFDFDYQTFHRIKLNDKVTFPNILDLNGFIDDPNCKENTSSPQSAASATTTSSPEKCSVDKLDDASTTDSGSALDAEESSSVGFSASNQTSNDTDTQDEDEGIDVSSVYNEKNRLLCISNGPYAYDLFSIMVHSGSASGGHYYAYIKDLKTGEWFCFNDQTVSRITYDDIRKTYGGANARGYYSSWSSSANAYMLMYRQADKEKNVDFFTPEEFPPHIKELVQRMVTEEAAEREAREIERLMCKIKLFCQHPKAKVMVEKKFKVHKDVTLKEATKLAYQELLLEEVVPLERCRLVKYEEVHDTIECSFDNQDNELISEVLGGVRSVYKFDLLMEVREQDKEFEEYKPGGITVKVYVVNLSTEEVEGPQTVRAPQTLTVKEFKELVGRTLSMDPAKMRVVQERYYNDHKPLLSDSKTLKDEGFYRSNKVYVEASGDEAPNFITGSQMYSILDRYECTITLYCNLPERSPEVLKELQIPPYSPPTDKPIPATAGNATQETQKVIEITTTKENVVASSEEGSKGAMSLSTATMVTPSLTGAPMTSSLPLVSAITSPVVTSLSSPPTSSPKETTKKGTNPPKSPSKGSKAAPPTPAPSPVTPTAPVSSSSDVSGGVVCLSDEDEGIVDVGCSSTVNSDQSASEESSLTSDSDRTLVGEPPEDDLSDNSPFYHNVSSPEENPKDADKSDENDWDAPAHCAPDTGWGDEEEKQNVKRYFRAHMTEENILRVSIDKRITVGQLKNELQKYVGVSEEHFKLYKYYINNSHEFECTRMSETLSAYGDNNVMKIRLGRALLPGEFKGKVFLLDPNNSEDPAKFLIDYVIRKGEPVSKVKLAIVKEVNSKCDMKMDPTKLRLRKKSWKNPQTIYLDSQVFDDDIILYTNWEYYLQELLGPDEKTSNPDEISIFTKRWRPSSYATDPLVELIFTAPTAEAVMEKLSQVSKIPLPNVEFAKGKGTFPCDISVLDIDTELDWTPKSGPLEKRPIFILDDGAVIYYRDSTETLKTLTEIERNGLSTEENSRLNRDYQSSAVSSATSTVTTSRTREKGLKIYFNQSN